MGMFDDEADTISVDVGEPARPPRTDTFRDASPFEQVHDDLAFEDTDVLVLGALATLDEISVTNVSVGRPGTNADWPPAPKQPATRSARRAGMFKAISSITKLTTIK